MSKLKDYFISDLHLGHTNIRDFCPSRQIFDSVESMNEELVKNVCETVKDNRLILVGDICFNRSSFKWGELLPKNTILVAGNHDSSKEHYKFYRELGWRIVGAYTIHGAIVTHIPVHPSCLESRFGTNIHGHLHEGYVWDDRVEGLKHDDRYINVSCEALDFVPRTLEELKVLKRKVFL